MANHSSACPILCASLNQDNSGFAISTKDGFKIIDSSTGRLCYERAAGAFIIVEMLYSSSLLAVVGAGEQPSLYPRRLCLFNTITSTPLREMTFLTSILAVHLNRTRLTFGDLIIYLLEMDSMGYEYDDWSGMELSRRRVLQQLILMQPLVEEN
ncbi:autophagy-related protein 18b-like [Hibiscus syriacus]|uniref:autophagy-related protein 18b-like n=1 Tax=Hibiscus syriacus TaxID=106335 RepID=UPI0019221650|nr:autophagy-related protein 18b-like [Hibiscus syriacus]